MRPDENQQQWELFPYEKGQEAEFQKKAEEIRDEMKQKTPTLAKLFETVD